MSQLLQLLRANELSVAFQGIQAGASVLEIGGAQGYQASLLSQNGFVVESVDIREVSDREGRYFPVRHYDGVNLPFRDESFDVVFSSNVLEHVRELPRLLAETRRVLAPGGAAIHVLPSPTWRIATSVAHYPHLLRLVWTMLLGTASDHERGRVSHAVASRGLFRAIVKAALPGAHGEFANSFAEVWEYRRQAWISRFAKSQWKVEKTKEAGLFYSGHSLCPELSMEHRAVLARFIGSACIIYYCRPARSESRCASSVTRPGFGRGGHWE